jgi:hypothetical protein
VDKKGIGYLKQNCAEQLIKDNIRIVVIYIHVEDTLRRQRALQRLNDVNIFLERNKSEDCQFTTLEHNVEYDWFVNNNEANKAMKIISEIIKLYI